MDIAAFNEDRILDLLPVGVLALDCELIIRRINPAACRFLGIGEAADVIGMSVGRLMKEDAFLRLRDGEPSPVCDSVFLPGGELPLERSVLCDAEKQLFVCVLQDAAGQQDYAPQDALRHAAELAETIREKQLHLVQEIAGLLGESAVEMQADVQELKQTLLPDRTQKDD